MILIFNYICRSLRVTFWFYTHFFTYEKSANKEQARIQDFEGDGALKIFLKNLALHPKLGNRCGADVQVGR